MQSKVTDPNISEDVIATASAPDLGIDAQQCIMASQPDPCTIVIMGATGDLASRKLMPALFNLYVNNGLPDPFLIVGTGRIQMDDNAYKAKMKSALKEAGAYDEAKWPAFARALYYRQTDFADQESFKTLAHSLRNLDKQFHTGGNRIFYMALPPSVYKPAARMIGQVGLATENKKGNGWSRIVVEKPFGTDLKTAVELNESLNRDFKEPQIFRIDHFLAKETVQNILMFRFANSLFEPIWNRRYIDSIHIKAVETLGIEHRASYYEEAGVLRDMFQNHMMQLLALTAMEPPSRFEAEHVSDEKVKVFRSLRPFSVDRLQDDLILGQYTAGTVNGKPVPAYREEPGVSPDSLTPTFAMMKVYLDNWRWQGVPFLLTSGKRMSEKFTAISVHFKNVPHLMFRHTIEGIIPANRLILGIYPDEKITLTFQTKNPGATVCLRTVTMDFRYDQNYSGPVLDAYAKVLIDCMLGDQMLFWHQDGVELCWKFLTPIINRCETCGDRADLLHFYEAGGMGPKSVEALK
jgi:glucose-6-phosphate 1-dehydrogenase